MSISPSDISGLPPLDLDVRPILRNGGEPFGEIMAAVAKLAPGQSLRLYATFKPIPLFGVLGQRGFQPEAREIGGGDWEVLFTPQDAVAQADATAPAQAGDEWPQPSVEIDNRDLEPPEPMVRTLEELEQLTPGQTLAAVLPREPIFLFKELESRGHSWRGETMPDGGYRIVIRAGNAQAAAS